MEKAYEITPFGAMCLPFLTKRQYWIFLVWLIWEVFAWTQRRKAHKRKCLAWGRYTFQLGLSVVWGFFTSTWCL